MKTGRPATEFSLSSLACKKNCDGRDRGLDLVRNIRNEILSGPFEFFATGLYEFCLNNEVFREMVYATFPDGTGNVEFNEEKSQKNDDGID